MEYKRADQRNFHFVYKTTCIVTGKYYFGIHSTDRMDDGYLGSGKRLRLSISKHGKENHIHEIVEFVSNRKMLFNREKEIVNEQMLADPLCMNLCGGGKGPSCHSEETKRKLSKAITGKKHSEETKAKISKTSRGKKLGPSPLRGKSISEEHKRKIGDSNRGRKPPPMSDETKAKISAKHRGRIN